MQNDRELCFEDDAGVIPRASHSNPGVYDLSARMSILIHPTLC
jgi:hypothetical protein